MQTYTHKPCLVLIKFKFFSTFFSLTYKYYCAVKPLYVACNDPIAILYNRLWEKEIFPTKNAKRET